MTELLPTKSRGPGVMAGLVREFRRMAPVATAGYLVVAVFGATFIFVKIYWPTLPDATVSTIAILAAGPLVLALVWPRLAGVKAFGLEVSLAKSSVQTNAELVAAITEMQYFSGAESIIRQIQTAIVRGGTEVLELDLKNGDYWWSTRLYLLAALADEESAVRAFAFVEQGVGRKFLGLCTPATVRNAIARAFPVLASVYSEVTTEVAQNIASNERIQAIVHSWVGKQFAGRPEIDVVVKVGKQQLGDWLSKTGQRLSTDSIEWTGMSDPQLLRQIIGEYASPYVALLREGRLDRIVNRSALAVRIAEQSLRS